jgi:hypothetical protein
VPRVNCWNAQALHPVDEVRAASPVRNVQSYPFKPGPSSFTPQPGDVPQHCIPSGRTPSQCAWQISQRRPSAARSADPPVQYPVILGIDSGLAHRPRVLSFERLERTTGAARRVTSGQRASAVFFQNLPKHQISGEPDGCMPRDPRIGDPRGITEATQSGMRDAAVSAMEPTRLCPI